MTEKTLKEIMVAYEDNHTSEKYNFYNNYTKRVIMPSGVKWVVWKMTDPAETLKMFREAHKEYSMPGIEEYKIPTSEPEENIPVHVIPDEEESVRPK